MEDSNTQTPDSQPDEVPDFLTPSEVSRFQARVTRANYAKYYKE